LHRGVIGGANYASQYDYGEFFSLRSSRLQGRASRQCVPEQRSRAAARDSCGECRPPSAPALTFAYDVAVEKDQPDYRLMLCSTPPTTRLEGVCNGVTRSNLRGRACSSLRVYCRNDWRVRNDRLDTGTSANDPSVGELFRELFMVVFPTRMR